MANNIIPTWIKPKLFENVLQETITDFQEIQDFKVFPALAPGENYGSVMLKVEIKVLLKNQTTQMESFMLKIAHDNEFYRNEMSKYDMFATESGMYNKIKPEFEKLYADVGLKVQFGAQAYKLPIQDKEYVLLEDLSKKGFKTAKRQNCLDLEHCESVLKRIAQFHAASAVRVEQQGMFEKTFLSGMLNENGRDLCKSLFDSSIPHLLRSVKNLKNQQEYYSQMEKLLANFTDIVFTQASVDVNEFNVLNHGDCWSNNIMFKYDKDGKLLENYLVDLQMPRYGTPAQDLLYFIISSAHLDIRVNKFDYLIKYYYDNLIEHLTVLKYKKPLPKLRDIHAALIKYSVWAVYTVITVMAGVLCEPTDTANMDNFAGDSEDGQKFKEMLYFNDKYVQHLEIVLPWLCNRGGFEC